MIVPEDKLAYFTAAKVRFDFKHVDAFRLAA